MGGQGEGGADLTSNYILKRGQRYSKEKAVLSLVDITVILVQ